MPKGSGTHQDSHPSRVLSACLTRPLDLPGAEDRANPRAAVAGAHVLYADLRPMPWKVGPNLARRRSLYKEAYKELHNNLDKEAYKEAATVLGVCCRYPF